MSSEMRECPFCGNGAWVVRVPDTRRFRPQCKKCGADLGEFDREADAVAAWNRRTLLARTEAGADGTVEPNGPEFTDWARAALSWVLYHHQGGSSPVGQPIRFALGMGANERLPDWRIADGKRWAAQTGSTTADFHTRPQDASGDAEIAVAALREIYETGMYPEGHTLAGEHAYKGEYHADCIGIAERALVAMQAKEAK